MKETKIWFIIFRIFADIIAIAIGKYSRTRIYFKRSLRLVQLNKD